MTWHVNLRAQQGWAETISASVLKTVWKINAVLRAITAPARNPLRNRYFIEPKHYQDIKLP